MKELIKNMLERGAFSQDFIVDAIEIALARAKEVPSESTGIELGDPKPEKRTYKKRDAELPRRSHDEIRSMANELRLRIKAERLTADEVISVENIVGRGAWYKNTTVHQVQQMKDILKRTA